MIITALIFKLRPDAHDLRHAIVALLLAVFFWIQFTDPASSDYVLPDTEANRKRGVVGCVQTSSGINCTSRSTSTPSTSDATSTSSSSDPQPDTPSQEEQRREMLARQQQLRDLQKQQKKKIRDKMQYPDIPEVEYNKPPNSAGNTVKTLRSIRNIGRFNGKQEAPSPIPTPLSSPRPDAQQTLNAWVHANWSKAPASIRMELQQSLRDPEKLNDVMRRHHSLISKWYRDETQPGRLRRLAEEYEAKIPGWTVKAQSWWNDPMHQSWVFDAFQIATAPVALSGPKMALPSKPKPAWIAELNKALRSMSKAKSPSGQYYNFPRYYRGNTAPPTSTLFHENPYKQIGNTRTWYWQDAVDVWIKRTPEMDQNLKWVLTGK